MKKVQFPFAADGLWQGTRRTQHPVPLTLAGPFAFRVLHTVDDFDASDYRAPWQGVGVAAEVPRLVTFDLLGCLNENSTAEIGAPRSILDILPQMKNSVRPRLSNRERFSAVCFYCPASSYTFSWMVSAYTSKLNWDAEFDVLLMGRYR